LESGPTTIGAALAEFLEDVLISGKAALTATTYGYKLRGRLDLDAPLAALDSRLCRALVLTERRTKAPATAAALYGALSAFCTWATGRGLFAVNPMRDLPAPKVPEGPNKALSERQVAALWDACRNDRERLMLLLFSSTGCRLNEIACAEWQDIDWERQCLRIMHAKGSKIRRVSLDAPTLAALEISRNGLSAGLILGIARRGLQYQFKALAKRAGIPWAHVHMLRHTYFTEMIRRGMSPLAAQSLGGWSDQRMLLKYAKESVEDAALAEARKYGR
jgi:integrase/recombinase XerD